MSKNKGLRILTLLLAVGLAVTVVFTMLHLNSLNSTLKAKNDQLAQIEVETRQAEATKEHERAAVSEKATGVLEERYKRDQELSKELFSLATTWSDGKEYDAARKNIMGKYGMAEDSPFMSRFLPNVSRTAPDGTYVSRVDAEDLNSAFADMDMAVVGSKDGGYEYFATVKVNVYSADETAHVVTTTPISYTIDAAGAIVDIQLYQPAEAPVSTNE